MWTLSNTLVTSWWIRKNPCLWTSSSLYPKRKMGVLRYQGRLFVLYVDDLRGQFLKETRGLRYSIHPGATKMYYFCERSICGMDRREIYQILLANIWIVNKSRPNIKSLEVCLQIQVFSLWSGRMLMWTFLWVFLKPEKNMILFGSL